MNRFLTFLLLSFVLGACTGQSWSEIRVVASQPATDEEYQAAVGVLKNRLSAAEIDYQTVRYLESEKQIVILLEEAVEQHLAVEAIARQLSIGFWPTVWTTDEEGVSFWELLTAAQREDKNLSKLIQPTREEQTYQPDVFAMTTDTSLMPRTISSLRKLLPDNVLPMWSAEPDFPGPDQQTYFGLFLLRSDTTGRAPINQDHISKAEMFIDEQMGEPILELEFDEGGTLKWRDMTTEAAYAGNKSIAISLDNRVYFAPRVREPIGSGKSWLTGYFTARELDKIASQLGSGNLPMPLTVISIEPLKE